MQKKLTNGGSLIDLHKPLNVCRASAGTGKTKSGIEATNVSDLGTPMGNISNARLNLNTCHSNSTGSWLSNKISTSRGLMGTKETLMQSFGIILILTLYEALRQG